MPLLTMQADVGRLTNSQSLDELAGMFQNAVLALGMTASASGMVSGRRALSYMPFHFVNWPADWIKLYQERKYISKDPLPRWAMVSGAAVSWSEVMDALPVNDPGREVRDVAGEYGFYEGFVTPVRTREGSLGLVTVGGGARAPFSDEERLYLQTLSSVALNKAEALCGPPEADPSALAFSLREQECLALLRQGFTDHEIARVLGISGETIRFHLNNARKKVGARNRVHLAAMSIPDRVDAKQSG